MSKRLLAALSLVMIISACNAVRESAFNPYTWFNNDSTEEVVTASADAPAADGRSVVSQIVSLDVDAFPGGVIVRAVGLPISQGFWDAELVEVETDDPTALVYEFRLLPPVIDRIQGTQRSREIIVGTSITTARLETVRTITVVGVQNQRTIRR